MADRDEPYRTGRKNARNIYRVVSGENYEADEHIGCMFTEDDGRLVVAALNLMAAERAYREALR